ncbi:hypothetical protein [Streptomyces sp. NPDC051994]|uniref:hypothetical protein n=1 Tax=unclassified Streptomyces TaxID=2593676 RepID=UPI003412B78A
MQSLPRLEPAERRGCTVCRGWSEKRTAARRTGDAAAVDEPSQAIGRHPHRADCERDGGVRP